MLNQPLDPSDRAVVARLRQMQVFSALDDLQLAEIIGMALLRKYDKGDEIITQGGEDQLLYFLITGELSIIKQGVEVGRIKRLGEVFGEMGVIDGSPRSATIKALTPVLCLAIEAAFLDRLEGDAKVRAEAVFYKGFSEVLAHRLRDCLERILTLEKALAEQGNGKPSPKRP